MDTAADPFAAARTLMVDGQIRPNKVYGRRLLDALRRMPRERFVPPTQMARAYVDEDVALGGGRWLTEPMVIARLLETAAVRNGERALVVGAAGGYSAALLDACGATVTALEEGPGLIAMMRSVLPSLAPNVVIAEGKLVAGWAAGAPYDLILVDGAVEDGVPAAIAAQLRPASPNGGGRLVTVRRHGAMGQGSIAESVAGVLRYQPVFDCATPLLAPLQRAADFVF